MGVCIVCIVGCPPSTTHIFVIDLLTAEAASFPRYDWSRDSKNPLAAVWTRFSGFFPFFLGSSLATRTCFHQRAKKHLIVAETYDERHRAFSIHVNTTRGLFVRTSFRTFVASNSVFNLERLVPLKYQKAMLGHQFAYSAAPIRKVKEVQFGILSPEEIVRTTAFTASVSHSYSSLCHRKPFLLPKSNIQRSWMRLPTSPRWAD